MEAINKLLQEIKKNSFDSGTSCWVDITHINDPHDFYIRPRAYHSYMPVVQSRGNRLTESDVSKGNIVIYKSPSRGHLRGKVIAITSVEGDELPTYTMFALDVGLIENDIPLRKIRRAQYTTEVPPLATHCQLAFCAPLGPDFDGKATAAMKTYVMGERAKMIVKSKTPDSLIVELYNSCPDDIATLLALTNFTSSGSTSPKRTQSRPSL